MLQKLREGCPPVCVHGVSMAGWCSWCVAVMEILLRTSIGSDRCWRVHERGLCLREKGHRDGA